jgi:hypothetical protein
LPRDGGSDTGVGVGSGTGVNVGNDVGTSEGKGEGKGVIVGVGNRVVGAQAVSSMTSARLNLIDLSAVVNVIVVRPPFSG